MFTVWVEKLPAASTARIVYDLPPTWAAVGVQLTTPVVGLIVMPSGAPASIW